MSWGVYTVAADKEAAKSKVDADTYIPEGVKTALALVIDAQIMRADTVLLIETSGHFDSNSGNGDFRVRQLPFVGAAQTAAGTGSGPASAGGAP